MLETILSPVATKEKADGKIDSTNAKPVVLASNVETKAWQNIHVGQIILEHQNVDEEDKSP